MSWRAEWTQRALKDVARLDRPMRERIVAAVERFAETGMGDVRRLRGKEQEIYRLRVGEWRILFRRRKAGQKAGPNYSLPWAIAVSPGS